MICSLASRKLSDVKREEQEQKKYNECLQHRICPDCGGELRYLYPWVYKCSSCKRTISRRD